jgi:glycosyltransferase involved in cell wall biosynthesis
MLASFPRRTLQTGASPLQIPIMIGSDLPPARPPLSAGISIIVPVYNSEQTLDPLAEWIVRAVTPGGEPFEILLVNDGSQDGSWGVIERLAMADAHVRGIDLMRNSGQHNALLCGLRAARYATAVTLDDDLQNPPEEIPRLLEKLEEGFDVVYGTPGKERHGLLRDLASWITKLVLKEAMGADTARSVSAFRAVRTELREAFSTYSNPYVNLDVLLTWGTQRFAAVDVRHEPRKAGSSNYTLRMLITHALNMATGFSVLPLQLAGIIGLGFALFGFCVLVYVLGRYAIQGGSTVSGFPFLASIIAIFSGAQLFALGIIGEYLARIHVRSQDRPTYTVRRNSEMRLNRRDAETQSKSEENV